MSSLLSDLTVWVVKITLTKRSDASTVDWYFALDYWASGSVLYTGNPTIYPLLAVEPVIKRGVGVYAGIKYDVSVDLFGKTNLDKHHVTFLDQLELYEIHNAKVEFRVYVKPVDSSSGAHSDTVNIQQVCRVVDTRYDEDTGILSLTCRDIYFKDKELSKKLTAGNFPELDTDWDGEYGPIVFGQSTTSGQGVVIDAPFIDATAPAGFAIAKIFAGWGFTGVSNHLTKEVDRKLVRNQHREQVDDQYVQINFASSTSETVTTPVADPPNWPRDISRYFRGVVNSPAANDGRILTAVQMGLGKNEFDRCADIVEGQHLYNATNPDFLSAGDVDLSIEIMINPDTVGGSGGLNRIICAQGDAASGTLEWMLAWDPSGDNKVWFGISVDGTTISTIAKYGTALSAGTWYHIVAQHDKTGNAVGIYVNNNTVVTTSTGANVMTRRNGPFHIGKNINSDLGYDGLVYLFRYWNRLITGTDVSNLYNSGDGVLTVDISDTISQGMRCSCELNEPYGIRKDSRGNADLSEGTTTTSLSQTITYDYGPHALTFANEKALVSLVIYHAQTTDGGDTYTIQGTPLRRMPIDMDTQVLTSFSAPYIVVDPPLVMNPGGVYLIGVEFSNITTESYFLTTSYDSNGGSTHYARDVRRNDQNWTKQTNVRLYHGLFWGYDTGLGLASTTTLTTGELYSYYEWERPIWVSTSPNMDRDLNNGLDFKLGVKGLKDDSSGTYTGSAAAVIENPSDIIRFALMNGSFGLGLTSSDVDTTLLGTARTALSTLGITHQIVINRQTYAEDFILEVARQSRSCFYKTKQGKLALKVFEPINNSYAAVLSEAFHRGDFILLGVDDNDYSSVVNHFEQRYAPNSVNTPEDLALIRRESVDKKQSVLTLTPSLSSQTDTYRQGLCSTSQSLFGRREMTSDLGFFDSAAGAYKVQKYYCDRFTSLQKRATMRAYLPDFYTTLDLFSNVHMQHTGIPASDGTTLRAKAHYQGAPIVCYSEGVPCVVWAGGGLGTQIYTVEMQGAWMLLVGETVSQF